MSPQAIARSARILTMIAAAIALLFGMFLGPRDPVALTAAIATLVFAAITMIARRL